MSGQNSWIENIIERLVAEGRIIILSPNVTIKVYITSTSTPSPKSEEADNGISNAQPRATDVDVFELAKRLGVMPPLIIEKDYFKSKDHIKAVARKYKRTHVAIINDKAILIPSEKVNDFKKYGEVMTIEEYLKNVDLPDHDRTNDKTKRNGHKSGGYKNGYKKNGGYKKTMKSVEVGDEDSWYEEYADLLPQDEAQ